jgi:hypothetical protein
MELVELMELMELAVVVPGGGTEALCNRASSSTTTPHRFTSPRKHKKRKATRDEWPPADCGLPDDLEAGTQEQQRLFDDVDDSREGRLARLTGGHRHG